MVKIIKIDKKSEIPLVGTVMFGCIDRGTNIIQVRATTICNLKCPFCSTNANNPKVHPTEYIIEPDYLLQYIKEIAKFKGNSIILLDSVGDSTTYPPLIELIKGISKIKDIKKIIMESNGVLLNKKMINDLKKAGLNQINLSIHSLDKNLAKKLSGVNFYDIYKIVEIAKEIIKIKIELLLTPVWIPKINNKDIIELIKFSKEIKAKIGIQKYEVHKYGRKVKHVKRMNWYKFYKQLREWEKEFNIKLIINPKELDIEKRKSLPKVFKKNEKTNVKIKAPGWIKNQMIGVAKNRAITITNCNYEIDKTIRVKILRDKDNIYLAEPI